MDVRRADLPIASIFRYASPDREYPEAEVIATRELSAALKDSDAGVIARAVAYIDSRDRPGLQALFGGALLVPVPGSSPSLGEHRNATFAQVLAETYGAEVVTILERTKQVKQSSRVRARERPTVGDHYGSMRVTGFADDILTAVREGKRIVLVDDAITKGRTQFAAAALLRERFSGIPVVGFSMQYAPYGRDISSKQWYGPRTGVTWLEVPQSQEWHRGEAVTRLPDMGLSVGSVQELWRKAGVGRGQDRDQTKDLGRDRGIRPPGDRGPQL